MIDAIGGGIGGLIALAILSCILATVIRVKQALKA